MLMTQMSLKNEQVQQMFILIYIFKCLLINKSEYEQVTGKDVAEVIFVVTRHLRGVILNAFFRKQMK